MAEDILISRRIFIESGFMGAVGVLGSDALAQDPDPPLPPPTAPMLVGLDSKARGSNHLNIKWKPVVGAERYEVEFTSASCSPKTFTSIKVEGKFDGLSPNCTYTIVIRAINSKGSSLPSPALITCTRPPIPPKPSQVYLFAFQKPPIIEIDWNLTDFVAGVNSNTTIRVSVGKKIGSGQIKEMVQGKTIKDRHTDNDFKPKSTYHIRLSDENGNIPGGINLSDWSEGLVPTSIAGGPSSVADSVAQHFPILYMRSYYG